MRRSVPVPLGRGGAVSGVWDGAGKDTDGEHGELYLPGVPGFVFLDWGSSGGRAHRALDGAEDRQLRMSIAFQPEEESAKRLLHRYKS